MKILVVLAAAVFAVAAAAWLPSGSSGSSGTTGSSGASGAAVAGSLGLGAEALAASGVNAALAGSLLSALENAVDQQAALESASQAVDTLVGQLGDAQTQLEQNADDADLTAAVESLSAALPGAVQAVATARSVLLDAGLGVLSTDQRARVRRFLATAGMRLPAALRVADWSAQDLRAWEAALVAETRASSEGAAVSNEAASVLQTCRARSDVIAAQTGLDSSRAAIQEVFANWPGH